MCYILNIDCAVSGASICLSKNGELLDVAENKNQKDQAAWLQPAIRDLLTSAGVTMQELKAIAVSNGPGSYTGLRIGLSTAKGLCFALALPLIAIGTLEMMAAGVTDSDTELICPMIDARRMEVFTAVYNKKMETILAPCAMILDEQSFAGILGQHTVLFFGNGSIKFQSLINNRHAIFKTVETTAIQLIKISHKRLLAGDFNDVAYTEPMYIKNFHSSVK